MELYLIAVCKALKPLSSVAHSSSKKFPSISFEIANRLFKQITSSFFAAM